MNQELEHANYWVIVNKLSLNVTKSSHILFASNGKRPTPVGADYLRFIPSQSTRVTSTNLIGVFAESAEFYITLHYQSHK